jgi:hypothetical protein
MARIETRRDEEMTQTVEVQLLFEDLYRADMRLSLHELDEILAQLEAMPRPMRKDAQIAHKLLVHDLNKALVKAEKQLMELRRRHEALPTWLKPQKESDV